MKQQIFSNNQKISVRQIQRTMILEMFGISSLILPGILAKTSGTDGVFALLLGALAAAVLLRIWKYFTEKQSFDQALEACGKPMRLLISLFYGFVFLLLAGYVLFLLVQVVLEHLLPVQFEAVVLVTLTAAGIFGLLKGMECRVRIYEVVFLFLLVPLLVILGLAAVNVNVDYWPPICAASGTGFLKGAYSSFLLFSISTLFLFFQPHCRQPKQAVYGVHRALWITVLLNAVVYLILVGVFQTRLLEELPFPALTLMAVVKLPGGFFERQDAFMIAIWFFCLFSLLNSMLFYGKEMLQSCADVFAKKQTAGKNSVWACLCGGAVLVEALVFRRTAAAGRDMLFGLLFPLAILLPILIFGITARKGGSGK